MSIDTGKSQINEFWNKSKICQIEGCSEPTGQNVKFFVCMLDF